ncbi:hypothetical protein [Natrinema sp. 74]|uniref:hypothetical protein n=1 Tax=Natrinema sp. 74 TaxID=3384159 RepID=UPI0038D4364A
MSTTGDSSALVTLNPSGKYAITENNQLKLELTSLNKNAVTDLGNQFGITLNGDADTSSDYTVSVSVNNGTQPSVTLDSSTLTHDGTSWNTITASISFDLTGTTTQSDIGDSITISVQ